MQNESHRPCWLRLKSLSCHVSRRIVGHVVKGVVALAILVISLATVVGAASATASSDVTTLVNNLRRTVNIAPLATDPGLTSVAQQWANHLAAVGALSHNPNLATQAPGGWTKIGENAGSGPGVTIAFNALVASVAHYANMVDPAYNRIGIGVAVDTKGVVWIVQDFGGFPPPGSPTLVFPTNGTVIFPSPQQFSWSQLSGATSYRVAIGTTRGGTDLLNSAVLPITQLSYNVPALPAGEQLWFRVSSYAQSVWTSTDANFSVAGPGTATFTQPIPGSTGFNVTNAFTWQPAPQAQGYLLTVGTTPGGSDLAWSGMLPASQASYRVPALPAGTLWATISTENNNTWTSQQINFTAVATEAALISPTSGQAKVAPNATFTWSTVSGVQGYALWLGTVYGGTDLLHTALLAPSQSSYSVATLPKGRTIYVLLLTERNGVWTNQAITITT